MFKCKNPGYQHTFDLPAYYISETTTVNKNQGSTFIQKEIKKIPICPYCYTKEFSRASEQNREITGKFKEV
jgi:hypothetical protein